MNSLVYYPLFEKISRKKGLDPKSYYTPSELDLEIRGLRQENSMNGVRRFKRRVLGLCGTSVIKTLDELASVCEELRMVDSLEEGRRVVEKELVGNSFLYSNYSRRLSLTFSEVTNINKEIRYKLEVLYIGFNF